MTRYDYDALLEQASAILTACGMPQADRTPDSSCTAWRPRFRGANAETHIARMRSTGVPLSATTVDCLAEAARMAGISSALRPQARY